jgi:hypothetical protein
MNKPLRGRPKTEDQKCKICGSTHPFYRVGTYFFCESHKAEAYAACKRQGASSFADTRWLNEQSGRQFDFVVPHVT